MRCYTGTVTEVLFEPENKVRMKIELVGLQLEAAKFRSDVEKTFPPQCLSGLLTIETQIIEHLVDDLERSVSFLLPETEPFEYLNLFGKRSSATMPRKFSTWEDDTLHHTSSALDNGRKERASYMRLLPAHPYWGVKFERKMVGVPWPWWGVLAPATGPRSIIGSRRGSERERTCVEGGRCVWTKSLSVVCEVWARKWRASF